MVIAGRQFRLRAAGCEGQGERVYHAGMIAPRPEASEANPAIASPTERPAGIAIGHARLRDLPAIAQVQRRAFPPRLAYTLGTLVVLWALPWVRLLVARRGATVVGCVIGDRVLEGGRVINLAVHPAAQRQGIGAALLLAVEHALPTGDMTLMVQSGNTSARSLYRRVGYEDEADLPDYYGPGRPGVRMRKRREAGVVSRES
jgi:ribosomal-protein-alanine N-acetyltransferase